MICHRCAIRLKSQTAELGHRAKTSTLVDTITRKTPLRTRYRTFHSLGPRQIQPTDPRTEPLSQSTATESSSPDAPYSVPIKAPKKTDSAASKRRQTHPPSSVLAGTPLKGLGYMKNKGDPLALEDHEYPDWLWTCLQPKVPQFGQSDGGFGASKAQSRKSASRAGQPSGSDVEDSSLKWVPKHQQSIDLPSNEAGTLEGAIEAAGSRADVTKEMRRARRKSIKEANFLKTMR